MKLVITVVEITGSCPVYTKGDKIVFDEGYKLNLEETDAVCIHSLASILPYYNALYRGVPPEEMGLGEGYVQCLDPVRYTGGGTVTFKIEVE
jgi:uncharacterized repeat protein (TIGR04076 family)